VCGPPSDAVTACIRPTAKPDFCEVDALCFLRGAGGFVMYAVIRTGGKQYRVAPGDVVKIESVGSTDQTIEFSDVLAVSGEPGTISKPSTAKVTAEVLGEGRGDKILVFHLKRKKQYKKLQGHRQNFTEVRIKAIEADGVTYGAS
jgi:large subunit ribosomal protein L21